MKTVCKKLLCLMLVAMMLVSAVPFAFADGTDEGSGARESFKVNIKVYLDGEDSGYVKDFTVTEETPLQFTEAQAMSMLTKDNRSFDKWTNAAGDDLTGDKLTLGWLNDNEKDDSYFVCVYYNVTDEEGQTPPADDPDDGEEEEEENDALILTLWADKNKSSCQTITITEGGVVPSLTDYIPARKTGYTFDHWETADGTILVAGRKWASALGTEFFPVYYEDAANDDTSVLNINVVFYADGIKREVKPLITGLEFDSSSKTTMFDWLKSDGGVAEMLRALEEKGYTDRFDWDNRTIYSTSDTNYTVTKADMDSDGAKNVYIKVNAKAEYLADVYVYVHKDKDADSEGLVEMRGYMINDNISLSAVKSALKDEGYSWSSIKMYNDTEWAEVVRGENTTDRNSIEAKGTTKIHVYLYKGSYNSNADSSNPKTGDYITIAATTMVLAAAALVSVIELKKRKMI